MKYYHDTANSARNRQLAWLCLIKIGMGFDEDLRFTIGAEETSFIDQITP